MKNRIDEIISLMTRMGMLEEQYEYDQPEGNIDDNLSNDFNDKNLGDRILYAPVFKNNQTEPKTKDIKQNLEPEIQFDKFSDAYVCSDNSNSVGNMNKMLLPQAIYVANSGAIKKAKDMTLEDLMNAFTNIKGKKIYCPSNKDGLNSVWSSGIIQNSQCNTNEIETLCNSYINSIANNTNGRLGLTLELLFGKVPDRKSESDFGSKDNNTSTELKTKHTNSTSDVIAITNTGIMSLTELFSDATGEVLSEPSKAVKVINTIINKRIIELQKEGYCGFTVKVGGAIDDKKERINKNPGTMTLGKNKLQTNIEFEEFKNLNLDDKNIATITILGYSQKQGKISPYTQEGILNTEETDEEKVLETFKVLMNCDFKTETKGTVRAVYAFVGFKLVGLDATQTKLFDTKIPLNHILDKVEDKCPQLMVAFGSEYSSKIIANKDVDADVYQYGKADFFEWGGLSGDDAALSMIVNGLLTITFGLTVLDNNFSGKNNSIYPSCAIHFNYKKLENSLKTNLDGKKLFKRIQEI